MEGHFTESLKTRYRVVGAPVRLFWTGNVALSRRLIVRYYLIDFARFGRILTSKLFNKVCHLLIPMPLQRLLIQPIILTVFQFQISYFVATSLS